MITKSPTVGNFSPHQEPKISSHSRTIDGQPTPVELLLSRLKDVTKSGDGWMACCPAHDDRTPSLSIGEGREGRVLLKCFGEGCSVDAICESVGLKPADLFSKIPSASKSTELLRSQSKPGNRKQSQPKPDGKAYPTSAEAVAALERQKGRKADHTWTYHDLAEEPVGLILRWDLPDGKKDIRPVSRYPDGWRIKGMPAPRPLYHLPDLAGSSRVMWLNSALHPSPAKVRPKMETPKPSSPDFRMLRKKNWPGFGRDEFRSGNSLSWQVIPVWGNRL